jgi:osmoprotectant transport system permease protein
VRRHLGVLLTLLAGPLSAQRPVVIASKPFAESYLLAEMFAQVLEHDGIPVARRFGFGATELAWQALASGGIDVYPEYTGTGLLAILGRPPVRDPRETFGIVSRAMEAEAGARWLPPLGFENSYAIAVRRETAESLGLRTLTDLARVGDRLVAGFTPDFIGRPDGLAGLRAEYGLAFQDVRALLAAVKYRALADGAVDVIDGYSTDGLIARYDLVVLEDDRRFFPPYEAAALVGRRVADSLPTVISALTRLSGRLDVATMRRLNARIEVAGEAADAVAADALSALGLLGPGMERTDMAGTRVGRGRLDGGRLARLTLRHLLLVAMSLLAAILVAVPLGLALERRRGGAEGVIRAVGTLQTIPGIALLAFMIPLLGIGMLPAVVALFLYSLYPILRNSYTGVRDADPAAVAGAVACGMTPQQVLRQVRLPLAAPVIMAGVRTAAVINVGTATLAAFIGAGGLGDPIVAGLALSDTAMILSGAIPAALLALVVDGALGIVERTVAPRGR